MSTERSTYHQLQQDLRVLIEESPKGTKLPSEPELANQLGVSRATLREVMRTFESQGFLHRRQGVGTFIVKPTTVIDNGLEALESIETMASKTGLAVRMGKSIINYGKADQEQAQKLNLPIGAPIVEIKRVILTDNFPVAYLVDVLSEGIIPKKILNEEFSGSVLDLLIKLDEPKLAVSRTEISAVHAQPELAKVLNIQRGDTLLLLLGVLYDDKDHPVDFSFSYFLPGYFRLNINRKIGQDLSTNRIDIH